MSELTRVLGYAKPYKKEIIAAVILLGLVVMADLSIPRLVQVLIDDGVANQDMNKVFTTSALMIGASLLSALFMVGNTIASVRAGKNYEADLRDAVFKKVQTFSYGNLDDFNVGQLLTRMTSDINQLQMMIIMGLRMLTRAPLMFVGSITIMYSTNAQLANVMIALLPATLVLVTIFVRTMQPFFTKVQERLEHLNQVMQENLSGIRVVKAFVRREYENERFGDANTQLFETQLKFTQLMSIFFPIIMALMNLGTVAIIYYGGLQVFDGVTSVGQIMAFINYMFGIMFPVMMMAMMGGQISAASASAKRIMEVLDTVPEVQEAENPVELGEMQGRVVFDDVTFSYRDDGGDPVLTNISFIAEAGENVAILGSTGAGKSSLVNLIPRLYDVNKGKITIDGKDVKNLTTQNLMSGIGISLQDVVLFSGTIRDNIKYGRPEASEEEMLIASKAAQAHEFITGFPDGYDTMVGQRGVNLSGGQKQRVAIARALLVKPKILILDDSTSAVDIETETLIENALEELMADTTSFIIAQRISTVLNADKILVLDEGKIVAEGNHAQLMDTSPIYKEIYDSQLGEGGVTQ
ncbi:ABC transporter ATP-binding protein [Candidatus Bathyarchaeota archaeon]|jgi:ATP-binding cassette, subfamily B, multidrug efflux pump|nr:ABC transporter ATP-binding protein [Candidatus Bathyarchaeota archaeon]MBT4321536.1 ABC transporter ATP-binding protein [Candidatus Bathyarchaeota archaeon]MBT4424706.1 ABC transporter ATP-binding protein [Candidatus Bathyarchaeota archaeon]MBT5642159.1 ABC transporter ATP-binding protein [Candidatus Bathyarchaeota archaeon]MBT7186115.1 ABC transporter ATP-binding protein [Candidatus Bathyarchaeota archaeon]